MKILVTGANGFLGQHLCKSLKDEYNVTGAGKGEKRIPFAGVDYVSVDIIVAEEVKAVIKKISPDVIIHTAAMSKPDECERERAACVDVNVNATKYLVDAAKEVNSNIHFIYTSSDFVLGDDGPHDEEAIPSPLNFYGETKLAAEKIVAESGLLYSIVRPVFMYGEIWEGMRPTFLHWVKTNLESGKAIKVVCDQQRTPTYVGDVCNAVLSMIKQKAKGLFHIAGEQVLTPYDMAVQFAEYFQLDTSLIEPVTAATFKEPVVRAKKGGLKIGKAKHVLQYQPAGFNEAVKKAFG